MKMDNLDKYFEEATKYPNKFLEELGAVTNEHDAYIYTSSNGVSHINLAYVLMSYKDWLIENDIVKQK